MLFFPDSVSSGLALAICLSFVLTNRLMMCGLPVQLAAVLPLHKLSPLPWLPPQGLLAAACLPAASHPLWANNGRRGPSLEACSLGLRGGVASGWYFVGGGVGFARERLDSMGAASVWVGVGVWGGAMKSRSCPD